MKGPSSCFLKGFESWPFLYSCDSSLPRLLGAASEKKRSWKTPKMRRPSSLSCYHSSYGIRIQNCERRLDATPRCGTSLGTRKDTKFTIQQQSEMGNVFGSRCTRAHNYTALGPLRRGQIIAPPMLLCAYPRIPSVCREMRLHYHPGEEKGYASEDDAFWQVASLPIAATLDIGNQFWGLIIMKKVVVCRRTQLFFEERVLKTAAVLIWAAFCGSNFEFLKLEGPIWVRTERFRVQRKI